MNRIGGAGFSPAGTRLSRAKNGCYRCTVDRASTTRSHQAEDRREAGNANVRSNEGESEQGEILFSSREGCSSPRAPVNNVELKYPGKAAGAAEVH